MYTTDRKTEGNKYTDQIQSIGSVSLTEGCKARVRMPACPAGNHAPTRTHVLPPDHCSHSVNLSITGYAAPNITVITDDRSHRDRSSRSEVVSLIPTLCDVYTSVFRWVQSLFLVPSLSYHPDRRVDVCFSEGIGGSVGNVAIAETHPKILGSLNFRSVMRSVDE